MKIENITDWIEILNKNGLLCGNYNDKTLSAHSKKQLMDIVLDANGSSYLQEMSAKGYGLPYEFICNSFASYINGRYVAEYKNEKGNGYTSCLYCCSDRETILVDTTLCSVLGYTGRIVIAKNNFAKIYLDKNCNVTIALEDGAKAIVEYWKGSTIAYNLGDANNKRLQLIEH